MSKNLSDIFPLSANSSGGGMVVSATEPAEKVDGMMWLDSTTARVWIWDEDKWLEFPAGGSGGLWEEIADIKADDVDAVEIDLPEGVYDTVRFVLSAGYYDDPLTAYGGAHAYLAIRYNGVYPTGNSPAKYMNLNTQMTSNTTYSQVNTTGKTYMQLTPSTLSRGFLLSCHLSPLSAEDYKNRGVFATWHGSLNSGGRDNRTPITFYGGGHSFTDGLVEGFKIYTKSSTAPISLRLTVEGIRK